MKFNKPKIYDKDNNEIIPPEGATGWVQGMTEFAWTFDNPDESSSFIYKAEPYIGPLAETVEEGWKFSLVPNIFDDTWYHRMKSKKTRMTTRVLKTRASNYGKVIYIDENTVLKPIGEIMKKKTRMPRGYEAEEARHDRVEEAEEAKHEKKHNKSMIKLIKKTQVSKVRAVKGKKKPCKGK